MSLAPLADLDDLLARGIDPGFDGDVALDVASTCIRDAAQNSIGPSVTSTVTVNAPRVPLLALPGPVTAVSSVSVNGGDPLVQDQDFYVMPNGLYRPCGWDWYGRPVPVTVTFTHGLAVVPADIVDLTCALVALWLAGKATVETPLPLGSTDVRLDDYAEKRTPEAAQQVGSVWLPDRTRAALASRFGAGVSVVETG